jgi:hypothetical protein
MNEIVRYRTSPATFAVVGLTAAMAASATWPARETPAYLTTHSGSTYSFFEKSLTLAEPSTAQDFGREIAAVYASLSEGQEFLGAEFEAVWDANVASLYES